MISWRPLAAASVVGLGVVAKSVSARAQPQPVPVFIVSEQGEADRERAQDTATIARTLGERALIGPALSSTVDERFGSRAEWVDTLQTVRTRIQRSRRAYNEAIANQQRSVAEALLQSLEQDAEAILAQPLAIDRSRETRESLMSALLFVAESTIAEQPARATEALRKLATVLPEITLGPRAASTVVRGAFREQVSQLANASLVVQSVPEGCQVRRNGVVMGSAPAQMQGLVAGQHRVSVRCGALDSLTHRVTVGAGTTSTVQIDVNLDRAVRFGDLAGFLYANERAANDRMVADAAQVANALGAERAVIYRVRTRKAVVIDVLARSVVREVEPAEYARLPDALRGADVNTNSTTTDSAPREARAPRIAVRPRTRPVTSAPTPAPSAATNAAPSGAMMLFGLVFAGSGALLALGATGAWLGADYARGQTLSLGQEGLSYPRPMLSASSIEPPLRALAVGGWIAGGALLVTGATMVGLGVTRREPNDRSVRALVGPQSIAIEAVF